MSGGVGTPFWLALNWLARIFILMRPTIPNSPSQTQQLADWGQWNGYHYPKSIYGANIRMYQGKGGQGNSYSSSKLLRYIYCGQMQIQKSFANHRSGGTAHHVRLCVFLNMAFVSSVEPERLSVCSRWVLLCRIIQNQTTHTFIIVLTKEINSIVLDGGACPSPPPVQERNN